MAHLVIAIGSRLEKHNIRRWKSRCGKIENTYAFKQRYVTCLACVSHDVWHRNWNKGL